VRVRMQGSPDEETRDAAVAGLKAAHAPIVEIALPEPAALGADFMRWEIATAVAGALLGINPFDQPNVQQAKDATQTLLTQYKTTGRLPIAAPDRTLDGGIALTLTSAARKELQEAREPDPETFLTLLRENDYLALLAYLGPENELADELKMFRRTVRDRSRAATMFGYGPRYLHSTGQLHKGGPNTGVFVLISATPREDLPIPGEPFSFGTLELAQAVGDFASLDAAGRRALHAHLPSPDPALLRRFVATLLARMPHRT
jgi:transaldolase/glucose-6-phosphate isomerase